MSYSFFKSAFLAALLTAGCVTSFAGCRDEELPEEIHDAPIRELSVESADKTDIPVTVSHEAPPVELHSFTMPDFGTKKLSGIDESQKENFPDGYFIDEQPGVLRQYAISQGHVYFLVSYGFQGYDYIYENTFFDYNIADGSMEEIYTCYDPDKKQDIENVAVAGSKLYFSNYTITSETREEGLMSGSYTIITEGYHEIYAIDMETHDVCLIPSDESWDNFFLSGEDDRLLAYVNREDNSDYNLSYFDIMEYDEESGQWNNVAENVGAQYKSGITGCSLEKDSETGNIIISVDGKYDLDTGSSSISLVDANENGAIWTDTNNLTGYDSVVLHKFDAESDKHYTTDISSLGSSVKSAGDGAVIFSTSAVYYLIPELGMAFQLVKPGNYSSTYIGECTSFIGRALGSQENDFYWFCDNFRQE